MDSDEYQDRAVAAWAKKAALREWFFIITCLLALAILSMWACYFSGVRP